MNLKFAVFLTANYDAYAVYKQIKKVQRSIRHKQRENIQLLNVFKYIDGNINRVW